MKLLVPSEISSTKKYEINSEVIGIILKTVNLLLGLDERQFSEIRGVVFLVDSDNIKYFESETKTFELDFKNYSDRKIKPEEVFLLLDKFPSKRVIEKNPQRKEVITKLIQNSLVSLTTKSPKEDYLAYHEDLKKLEKIKSVTIHSILFATSESRIDSESEYQITNYEEYSKAIKILEKLPKVKDRSWAAYEYSHRKFFELLGSNYYNKIINYKNAERVRAHIHGEDKYIGIRSAEEVFNKPNYYYHDLIEELEPIEDLSNTNFLFDNVDGHSSNKYYNIQKALEEIKIGKRKLIFLGKEIDIERLLIRPCDKVAIPSKEYLKENITNIFISLLIEKFHEIGRISLLYEVIINNALIEFLKSIDNIDVLHKSIQKITKIESRDILENPFFWISFRKVIEEENLNKNNGNKREVTKNSIGIKFDEKSFEWVLTYQEGKHITSATRRIQILCFIILYNKKYNVLLRGNDLLDLLLRYDLEIKKEKNTNISYELIKKEISSLRSGKEGISKDNKSFQSFIKKYFPISNKGYWFDKDNDLELITDPSLKPINDIV